MEIVLISKGETTWEIEGRQFALRPGSLFFTLPWQEHGGVEEIQPSCEISYVCLTLDRVYARPRRGFRFHHAFRFAPVEERSISSALVHARRQAIPSSAAAIWLFKHFFTMLRGRGPRRESRARDSLKLLIADLADACAGRFGGTAQLGESERRVRNFTRILAERHAEPWTLESMSRAARLGRTQFSQLLKKLTGDTPVIYLNRHRLGSAQRLLVETQRPITDIAHAVGFNSSQYFAKVFKEFTETDARNYRRQAWAQQDSRRRS